MASIGFVGWLDPALLLLVVVLLAAVLLSPLSSPPLEISRMATTITAIPTPTSAATRGSLKRLLSSCLFNAAGFITESRRQPLVRSRRGWELGQRVRRARLRPPVFR